MGSHHLKGTAFQIKEIPLQQNLPEDLVPYIIETIEMSRSRMFDLWNANRHLNMSDIEDDWEQIRIISNRNTPLLHYLRSIYLKYIVQQVKVTELSKIKMKNFYWFCTLMQHQLTHLFLNMSSDDRIIFQCWVDILKTPGIDISSIDSDLQGGLSVARLIKLFWNLNARVYFPTTHLDMQHRIDLVVWFPKKNTGFCIQIKSGHRETPIFFRPIHQNLHKYSNDDDILRGVFEFKQNNPGVWLPVEIQVSSLKYDDYQIHTEIIDLIRIDQHIAYFFEKYQQPTIVTPIAL